MTEATARVRRLLIMVPAAALATVVTAGCSSGPFAPSAGSTPQGTAAATASTDPSGSATGTPTGSATPDDPGSAVPGGTPAPGGTPSGTGIPGVGSSTPGSSTAVTPTAAASPLTCTSVLPRRVGRVTVAAARTTDVSTVVSDGRTVTPGTSQQTDFADPQLIGPNGGVLTDANSIALAADLARTARVRVLTTRPESPDARADVGKRPFDVPGTYALYNASGLMSAQLVVLCSGQEQTWEFRAEANPVNGTVNCAVEPARSNALARSVYQTSC